MRRASLSGSGPPEGVRFFDHTADTGVEVRGRTLEECFARAGAALFAAMYAVSGDGIQPPLDAATEHVVSVELSADDHTELLVTWLEELLYRSELEGLCFVWFEVELEDTRLRARAGGVPVRMAGLEASGPTVKAITRHLLAVDRTPDGCLVRVVFDV